MARAAASLTAEGRVQGVGYRWWVVETARRLGLSGWVRNRSNGAVEMLAIGEPAAIDALENACRRGPPAAAVLSVTRGPAEDDGSGDFQQRATL